MEMLCKSIKFTFRGVFLAFFLFFFRALEICTLLAWIELKFFMYI